MKSGRLSSILVERLFGLIILLLLIGLVIDFIFVTNFLKTEATNTETLRQQAEITDRDITKLKSADIWLKENDDVVKRAHAIVSQSKLYQYQNQIISDLNSYANQTGTSISSYSFSETTAATPGATTTTPSAPAAGAAKAPSGLNSITANINFGDKVDYIRFLSFLELLEQNVTRMQVTQITFSPSSENPHILAGPTITLNVYTR